MIDKIRNLLSYLNIGFRMLMMIAILVVSLILVAFWIFAIYYHIFQTVGGY